MNNLFIDAIKADLIIGAAEVNRCANYHGSEQEPHKLRSCHSIRWRA